MNSCPRSPGLSQLTLGRRYRDGVLIVGAHLWQVLGVNRRQKYVTIGELVLFLERPLVVTDTTAQMARAVAGTEAQVGIAKPAARVARRFASRLGAAGIKPIVRAAYAPRGEGQGSGTGGSRPPTTMVRRAGSSGLAPDVVADTLERPPTSTLTDGEGILVPAVPAA